MWQEEENIDIPYNYLIGGDGRAYEARGWHRESDHVPIHSNSSLSIAFIGEKSIVDYYYYYWTISGNFIYLIKFSFAGNFTHIPPSTEQIGAAYALILELKHQKKIAKNYRVLGVSYHKRAYQDGAALFNVTSEWKAWDEVLSV